MMTRKIRLRNWYIQRIHPELCDQHNNYILYKSASCWRMWSRVFLADPALFFKQILRSLAKQTGSEIQEVGLKWLWRGIKKLCTPMETMPPPALWLFVTLCGKGGKKNSRRTRYLQNKQLEKKDTYPPPAMLPCSLFCSFSFQHLKV